MPHLDPLSGEDVPVSGPLFFCKSILLYTRRQAFPHVFAPVFPTVPLNVGRLTLRGAHEGFRGGGFPSRFRLASLCGKQGANRGYLRSGEVLILHFPVAKVEPPVAKTGIQLTEPSQAEAVFGILSNAVSWKGGVPWHTNR